MNFTTEDRFVLDQMLGEKQDIIKRLRAELEQHIAELAILRKFEAEMTESVTQPSVTVSAPAPAPSQTPAITDYCWANLAQIERPTRTDVPTYDSFFNPVLRTLSIQSPLTAKIMRDMIVKMLNIPESILVVKEADGKNGYAVNRRINWARHYMGLEGFIALDKAANTWHITKKGLDIVNAGFLTAYDVQTIASAH